MKSSFILSIVLFAVATTVSCQKAGPTCQRPTQSGKINCNVYAEDTKGPVIKDDGLQAQGFFLAAYIDDDYYVGNELTPSGKKGQYIGSVGSPVEVSFSSSEWTISGAPTWIAMDSTRFWCWSPKTLTNGTRTFHAGADYTGKDTLSFRYTMPSGGQKSGSPAHACDATNQQDLIFAYNCKYHTGSDATVSLKFRHALSQINFIVYPKTKASQTSGDGSLRSDYQIIDISLQGMKGSGKCTIKGKPEGKTPNTSFTWSEYGEEETFTQYYGANFSAATSTNVPSGWTYKDYSSKAHFFCDNSFFIIPGKIENATLSVTFKKDDTEVTKLVKLSGVGTSDKTTPVTEWLPSHRYTYRLAISGEITSELDFGVTLENWETVNDSMRL